MERLFDRIFTKYQPPNEQSFFLFGPRACGKTTWLKKQFPKAHYYDLLKSDEYIRLLQRPELLRTDLHHLSPNETIIIDETQKIPILLNEVHWLIENKKLRFILSGSSARKLRRGGVNLLGGLAWSRHLFPLVYKEISDFNLIRALNNGLIPKHYLSENPKGDLSAYTEAYLKEEIMEEGLTRNIPAFSRFLEVAARTNGDLLNYANVGRDCGVSAKTVREYYQILEDTWLGYRLSPWRKRKSRRLIETEKFFLFDIGVTVNWAKRGEVSEGSELFGKAFEHFILLEIYAYNQYSGKNFEMCFWRTASGSEVDLVLGEHEVAIEIKSAKDIRGKDLSGIRLLNEEFKLKRKIIVSRTIRYMKIEDFDIYPWQMFLGKLWEGEII